MVERKINFASHAICVYPVLAGLIAQGKPKLSNRSPLWLAYSQGHEKRIEEMMLKNENHMKICVCIA
jgi:hypothetical protein